MQVAISMLCQTQLKLRGIWSLFMEIFCQKGQWNIKCVDLDGSVNISLLQMLASCMSDRSSYTVVVGGSFLRIQLRSSSISCWESWWWRPAKEWKVEVMPAFFSNTDVSSPHWWSTKSSLVPWHWNNSGRRCPALTVSATALTRHNDIE